jgi:hypothetical protein
MQMHAWHWHVERVWFTVPLHGGKSSNKAGNHSAAAAAAAYYSFLSFFLFREEKGEQRLMQHTDSLSLSPRSISR